MKISNKLLLGLFGIAFLMVIVGLISYTTNSRVIVSTSHLLKNAIAERRSAAAAKSALVAIRDGAQSLMIEKYHAASEPKEFAAADESARIAQSEIEAQSENYRTQLKTNRAIIEKAIETADNNQTSDAEKEKIQLAITGEIEREFTTFSQLLEEYVSLINSDLNRADEFEHKQLQPHYETRLLPLINQYEVNASQKVETEAKNIENALLRENKITLFSTAFTVLVAFLAGIYLANSISKPIRRLAQAALEFGGGNFDTRIAVNSSDEIGVLGDAFNDMAEQIESRTKESKNFYEQMAAELAERNRAETAFRRSEENYRQLADAMPQIVWTARSDGSLDYSNQRWFEYTKMKLEETVGWGWKSAICPDDLQNCLDAWGKAIKTGDKFKVEYRFRRASDGEYRWHLGQALPIRDAENQIVKWFGTCTDIHEQKKVENELRQIKEDLERRVKVRTDDLEQANSAMKKQITERERIERALIESTKRERAMIENARDIICTVDAEGRFASINPACFKMWGYQPEELIGRPYIELVAPEDVAKTNEVMTSIMSGKETANFENCFCHKNGALVNTMWTYYWSASEQSLFAVAHDITERSQAQEALEKERKFLDAVLDNMNDALVACNAEGELTLFNRASQELHGLPAEPLAPEHWAEHYDLYQADGVKPMSKEQIPLFRALHDEMVSNIEMVIAPKNQKPRTLIANGQAIFDAQGRKVGAVVGMHDITKRKQAEKELQKSEYKLRTLLESMSEGLLQIDNEDRIIFVNDCFCRMVGYSSKELMGTDWSRLIYDDDRDDFNRQVNKRRCAGISDSYEISLRKKSGEVHWSIVGGAPILDAEGAVTGSMGVFTDITERKRIEKQLLHDAFHDDLTGLANRALFTDHLQMTIERARREHSDLFAVLFIDFDRFKVINDSLGHAQGDNLLKQIARRLDSSMRSGDLVARLGGDEFTILLDKLSDSSVALLIVERIQKSLEFPFEIGGGEIFISASIGIAFSTIEYEIAEDMVRDADIAMYRAKAKGKAQYQVFDLKMHKQVLSQLRMETELRQAIEQKEFCLYYQPIFNLETNRIVAFESLVRWNHPEFGLLPPNDFIPIAEENNLIIPLGQWILYESCRQIRQWQTASSSASSLSVSVNLSFKQFLQPDLAEQVAAILNKTGLDPQYLKLEITESHVMENSEKAIVMMNRLRALGVELSVDDFGTGYSSLSYLHRLPVNYLKIDRSFVTRMIDSQENGEIVYTIIKLAQNLKMKVISEGIETADQLSYLKNLNCEFGQGFYLSKPLEPQAIGLFIEENAGDSLDRINQPVFNTVLNM